MARQLLVQAPRALDERGEEGVAGCETDTRADRGDVVQVVPGALELEQDRPDTGQLGGRAQPACFLAGVRVGDRV